MKWLPDLVEPLSPVFLEFPFEYTFTEADLNLFRTTDTHTSLGFRWAYLSDEEIYIIRGGRCYYHLSINPQNYIHTVQHFMYEEPDDISDWIQHVPPYQTLLNILQNWTGHDVFPEYRGIKSIKDLPIAVLKLPYWVVRRIKLAMGNDVTVAFFKNPFIIWFSILQDFDACVHIAKKVTQFNIHVPELNNLSKAKKDIIVHHTKLHSSLSTLQLSDRLIDLIEECGVQTIAQLASYSAKGLDERGIVNHVGLKEVRKALLQHKLLLKDDYLIRCKHCGQLFAYDDPENQFCGECK